MSNFQASVAIARMEKKNGKNSKMHNIGKIHEWKPVV